MFTRQDVEKKINDALGFGATIEVIDAAYRRAIWEQVGYDAIMRDEAAFERYMAYGVPLFYDVQDVDAVVAYAVRNKASIEADARASY
jgi:hypothetical protein